MRLWKQVDLFTISILATLFTLKSYSLPLVERAAKVNDSITFARLLKIVTSTFFCFFN